ncbi:hypothetical protein KFJ24_02690 [Marinobacter sediminum]|uniref:hypothetical protein n=1 Tax=Marinobacter sediminum TaxID=256323 RepID=UPI0020307CD4|nr:hypothetical protein [Marinobacter sediminum]MCM0611382.1 hypothetical protein [Marinobacter sediminum]
MKKPEKTATRVYPFSSEQADLNSHANVHWQGSPMHGKRPPEQIDEVNESLFMNTH